jgi:hypothetical protein
MVNPADQLTSLLNGLPDASELRGLTKDQLRARGAELGISTAGIRTKQELVQSLSDGTDALRLLEGAQTKWFFTSESHATAFIEWHESSLLVDLGPTTTKAVAVNPADQEEQLGLALQQAAADIQEIDAGTISIDRLLDLLDRYVVEARTQIYVEGEGLLIPHELGHGEVAWLPEDIPQDLPFVATSHWDFVGPGDPLPASDNPGTVYVSTYRGVLIGHDHASEVWHFSRSTVESLTARNLLESLAEFYEHLVGSQTYSLQLPDNFDDADISDFLQPADGVGALRVNGAWWYETPTGWTRERLPPVEADPLTAATISGVSLCWAYGGWSDGPLDVLLMPEADKSLRIPLALLAGHKVNGWQREEVALITVHLHDGEDIKGVALRDDGTVSQLVGVEPTLRVDPQENETWIRTAAGDWNNVEVQLDDAPPGAADILWSAIQWLRHPGTGEFTDQPGEVGAPSANQPEHVATVLDLPPLNAPPSFQPVQELDTGSARFVMLNAIGRDADGLLWIDPTARARRAGLPTEDPVVLLANDGVVHVDVSELERPVPSRSDRHALHAIEGRPDEPST